MTKRELEKMFRLALVEQAGVEFGEAERTAELKDDEPINDQLELDSMDLMEVLMALEEQIGDVDFGDYEINGYETLGEEFERLWQEYERLIKPPQE